MEKRTSILKGSLVAGAIVAVSGFSANTAKAFSFERLGTGNDVRASLLERTHASGTLELACGGKQGKTDTVAKKGKDGKCGEGKCGGDKKKNTKGKKGKDGKCGEGKCGGEKKKNG